MSDAKTSEIYRRLEQAAYNNREESEKDKTEEEFFKNRGKVVLGIARISEQDLKEKIGGNALEEVEKIEHDREEERFLKKLRRYNARQNNKLNPKNRKPLTAEEYRKKLEKREQNWLKVPILNIPYALGKSLVSLPDGIKHTIELGKKSNELKKSNNIFSSDEIESLSERVSIANEDVIKDKNGNYHGREDNDVKNIAGIDKNSDIYKTIREYTEEVAKTHKDHVDLLEKARKEALEKLAKSGGDGALAVDLKKIEKELAGALAGDFKEYESGEITKAVDKYLDTHISIVSADVKTGLAVKEVYSKLKDKATIEHGILAGLTVGLGSSLVGVMKSKAIQNIAGPGLVQHGIKVGTAAIFGTVRAGLAEKKRQQKTNLDAAIHNGGKTIESSKDKKGREHTYELTSSADLTEELKKNIAKLKEFDTPEKKDGAIREYTDAAKLIAKIQTLNSLQNKHGVQLISYNGRENVEKSKLEMFKAISELKKAMEDLGPERFDKFGRSIDEVIKNSRSNSDEIQDVLTRFEAVKILQSRERRHAAIKGGITAALTTAAIDQALHHEAIWNDFKETDLGKRFLDSEFGHKIFPNTVVVPISTETVETAGVSPENHESLEEYYHKPVIIEQDPDGNGVIVALDTDGDGKITAADRMISGSFEKDGISGIDLTKEENINSLKNELAQYNIELEHEVITTEKFSPVTVSEYLKQSKNVVDNSGGVDWSRSETRVGISSAPTVVSADGMNSYEISVSGINGYDIPSGAKLFIDLDGDSGTGQALEFTIENGKAIVPADVVDTSMVGNGGIAGLMGTVRVGEMDGNTMISYATEFGRGVNLSDTISAATESTGHAFTAIDLANHGERLSQFAVDSNNNIISNLSEIFNGIETTNYDHLPATIKVNDIGDGQNDLVLGNGGVVKDFDVEGGYHAEYDAFENVAFKNAGNDSLLGTPITWDFNGDGIMSAEEEVNYIKQMFVRTATNPYMLGQNASNYGILEPSRLASLGITEGTLIKWGIADGVIDSEEELNIFLDNLKLSENASLWDKVANETINEMETQLQGAHFEVETVTSRISTYANSHRDFDTASASTPRIAIYSYHEVNGEKVYDIGNQGWWCEKYDALGEKVGDMTLCEQKCIVKGGGGSSSTTTTIVTPTPTPVPVEPEPTPEPTPIPLTPKNPETEIANAGEGVVPEYVETPASELPTSPYEVNENNIYDHTVSTEESAENAARAIEDAISAREAAIEGDKIVADIEQATTQEEVDNIGTDLWRQFQGGE